jgi:GH24 family phage-related lysozyme (muramidase)
MKPEESTEQEKFYAHQLEEHELPETSNAELMIRIKALITRHEGVVPHMYRDSDKGKITVGIGFLLPSESAVRTYRWIDRQTKKGVGSDKAIWEWKNLHRAPYGQAVKASYYADGWTKLGLDRFTINTVFSRMLYRLQEQLRGEFREQDMDFSELPPTVQIALFDIGWNTGGANFSGRWPKMTEAIKNRDWLTAAHESHREWPVSAERNNTTRDLILEAIDLDRRL